jgi:ankyrin repeat protein
VIGDSFSAMWGACEKGDSYDISSLLDEGKNVDYVVNNGMTPIMVALWHGHLHAAIMLAGRGADLSRVNNSGSNMLKLHQLVGIVSVSSGCLLIPALTFD